MNSVDLTLFLIVLAGVFAGAIMIIRQPLFWFGLIKAAFSSAFPLALSYITKRMNPEVEKAWRDCQKRGGKWNSRTRRCE